ncbi:CCA tRNA nucleotidyltransferase [Virgibacillus phasianinus]|uniref:CCA-adding enzyme n=1 Tax=Virgibacillus phasianinus TaxID=2017483 RepID=A0A220U5N9_9BACI|nr:CCA tRNA nucleotidyltransferase [Virgibacillus phasianinus]ASK63355.1 CCA tRNA nucleotidyltransferase [Virgibacillus phasianinus]
MLDTIFNEAVDIMDKLEENGYQAYFVGGCVRDSLLKRPISDVDIATSAPPDKVQQLFPAVIPVGVMHGTVIVRHLGKSYEVTTFRVDGKYTDKRHPDEVEFIQTIDGDLKRRDFTINALAMNREGRIIDLFNGIDDLHQKVIRTVGKGIERFREDSLRIIRAIRFSSQLGFFIDPATLDDMKVVAPEITQLAVERVRVEITKFFGGRHINLGMDYLRSTELYKHLPVMINYPYIINKLPLKLFPLKDFSEVVVLFHYMEPAIPIKEWVTDWKCSNKEKWNVKELIASIDYFNKNGLDNWLVYCLSSAHIDAFIRLVTNLYSAENIPKRSKVMSIYNSLTIHQRDELKINGHDLIALFPSKKKGPWIHKTLKMVEKQVVLNHVANKNNELKDWVKWNPPGTN